MGVSIVQVIGLGAASWMLFVAPVAPVAGSATASPTPHVSSDIAAEPESGLAGRDPAVVDLVEDLGLTVEQAEVQMQRQADAARAESEMGEHLVAAFSGRRTFHEHGARVVVTISDEAMAAAFREHYARYGLDVVIAVAALDRAATEALIDEVNGALRSSRADGDAPLVRASEPVPGVVTLTVARGQLNDVERRIVDTAAGDPDRYRIEHTDRLLHGDDTACDYTPDINCDPPFRGSVRIARDDTARTPNCTAGFVTRSRANDQPYVLTAGHCRTSEDVWARFANGAAHRIGPWWRNESGDATDVGIVAVANPSGWNFGWPIITLAPNHGPNDSYVIDAVGEPAVGDRICFTAGNGDLETHVGGSFDGGRTDCGTVDDRYDRGGGTDGLFRVEGVCLVPGDSGSPAFSYSVAYGVQSASDYANDCVHAWSEQASEAQDQMNVYIVTA